VNSDRSLTQESFDLLLSWLDPSRESAGKKYEDIRSRLIKIFLRRGCPVSEELADETIDRVVRKVHILAGDYDGDPALYFYGVAQKVFLEYAKKKPPVELTENPAPKSQGLSPTAEIERKHQCLDQCVEALDAESRELILGYYQGEKSAKIDYRKELAARFGIAVNTLRMRAHRIKAELQRCVSNCLRQLET
jgi:RNA polymerase sigma factor (sigma-70 family)